MNDKTILTKPLRLEKCFQEYKTKPRSQSEVFKKFENVWGRILAAHFLSNYSDAESLIWGLDSNNMKLFIDKF